TRYVGFRQERSCGTERPMLANSRRLPPRQRQPAQGDDVLLDLRRAARVLGSAGQVQLLAPAAQAGPARAAGELAVEPEQADREVRKLVLEGAAAQALHGGLRARHL